MGGAETKTAIVVIEAGGAVRDALRRAGGMEQLRISAVDARLVVYQPPIDDVDSNVEAVRNLMALRPCAPLIFVAHRYDERHMVAMVKAGSSGFLVVDEMPSLLVPSILEVLAGGIAVSRVAGQALLARVRSERDGAAHAACAPHLGARKREILERLAQGLSYHQIGLALGISVNTVRTHVREIYEALGASTKVEAVLAAMECGILPRSGDDH